MKKKNVLFVMKKLEEEYNLIANIVFVRLVLMNGLNKKEIVLIVDNHNDYLNEFYLLKN